MSEAGMMSGLIVLCGLLALPAAAADSARSQQDRYAAVAGVQAFSASRGSALYRTGHAGRNGGTVSCADCHGADPRQPGKTRVGKRIEALAPSANPERFSDAAKTEKWFRRNCQDVLQRECTPQEKGDFIAWLISVK